MGGYKKFHKAVTKVIDPFNLVDPLNVLPTSWMAGKKPFTFDKDYGKLQWNLGSPAGSYAPMTKGLSSNPQYFAQQQQMLNNMRQQQQAKLANLQSQGQAYPTAAPTQSVETAQAPTTTTPVALAQSKVSDTTAPADMPTEFIYKPATAQTKTVAANTFQMPDMSSIKFGGA
jgi:hypothetical protein